jgi:translation initiation factor IF-1
VVGKKKTEMKNNKRNRSSQQESPTGKADRIVMEGVVDEALPGTFFRVLSGNNVILATLAGKLRQNHIRVLPGDSVRVEVSPYDTTRGRIVWRR